VDNEGLMDKALEPAMQAVPRPEYRYTVEDMTCGHCAAAVTQAVQSADPLAVVRVDLPAHRVTVLGRSEPAAYEKAIRKAGFTPVAA
jgi:copper chaperone